MCALAAVPLLGPGPADAASGSVEKASAGAYFYEVGVDKPDAAPAAPPNVGADGDFVSPGDLAVAVTSAGRTNKESFLQFDLEKVPVDAVVGSAVVSVPLAKDGNGDPRQSRSVQPAAGKVRACPADATGFNGEDGANITAAPKPICEAFAVTAKESADRTAYEFDVTPLVTEWLTGENNGMALVPTVESSAFQVVFRPFDQATLRVQFTAPAAEASPAAETAADTGAAAGSAGTGTDAGSGTDSGSTDPAPPAGPADPGPAADAGTDSGAAVAAPPALPTDMVTADAPAAAADPAQAPAVAAAGSPRVVRAAREVPLTPTPGFWLGSLAVAALLALVSLVMGDPRVAVAGAATPSRLSLALQRGSAAGGLLSSRRPA